MRPDAGNAHGESAAAQDVVAGAYKDNHLCYNSRNAFELGREEPKPVKRIPFIILAFLMAMPLASGALAQDFPKWSLDAACNAGDDTCRPFEAEARGKISGIWPTLPPNARSQCVSETEDDKSYRELYGCLVMHMGKRLTRSWQRPEDRDEGPVEPVNLTPAAKTPENGDAESDSGEMSETASPSAGEDQPDVSDAADTDDDSAAGATSEQ